MALEGKGKYAEPEGSRSLIYVSRHVTRDSQWPFKAGDELTVRIEGKRVVVEKAPPERAKGRAT